MRSRDDLDLDPPVRRHHATPDSGVLVAEADGQRFMVVLSTRHVTGSLSREAQNQGRRPLLLSFEDATSGHSSSRSSSRSSAASLMIPFSVPRFSSRCSGTTRNVERSG